jgi:hypothetical protein
MDELLKQKRYLSMLRGLLILRLVAPKGELPENGKEHGRLALMDITAHLIEIQDFMVQLVRFEGGYTGNLARYTRMYEGQYDMLAQGDDRLTEARLITWAHADLRQHRNIAAHRVRTHGAVDPYETPDFQRN